MHDRNRDSDEDDYQDRDYDVAALANNLSQAFHYGIYNNDDMEEVWSFLWSTCLSAVVWHFIVSILWVYINGKSRNIWKFSDENYRRVMLSISVGIDF